MFCLDFKIDYTIHTHSILKSRNTMMKIFYNFTGIAIFIGLILIKCIKKLRKIVESKPFAFKLFPKR
jgi:hypothetical protein